MNGWPRSLALVLALTACGGGSPGDELVSGTDGTGQTTEVATTGPSTSAASSTSGEAETGADESTSTGGDAPPPVQCWLDPDDPPSPAEITELLWSSPPGFYLSEGCWQASFHAPEQASAVRLELLVGGELRSIDLAQSEDGAFWFFIGGPEAFEEPPQAGDAYRFAVTQDDTETFWQDPAARWTSDTAPHGYSRVTDGEAFVWSDDDWARPRWEDLVLYELHPLRFTSRNGMVSPYAQVTAELDGDGYLNHLGASAVALMPVSEFPGELSWGYNPSFYYAIESAYGTPDEFKALVDAAHGQGMAVILDVVINHMSDYENILGELDPDTYVDGSTTWGPMPNFDDPVARHFFVQNLRFLVREYHVDGFRFDATRLMHVDDDPNITVAGSGGGWALMRALRSALKQDDPGLLLIAEELPNDWFLTAEDIGEPHEGDVHGPFDAQWNDAFHDRFRDVLTGGNLDNLYTALQAQGDSWHDGVNYVESHDEVGNHDARIALVARDGRGLEMAQIGVTGTLMFRNIPMLFMGQEAGETAQFHIDAWDDRIPLDDYEADPDPSKVLAWTTRMIEIRRDDPDVLSREALDILHVHDGNGVAAFSRAGGAYLVVLNFGPLAFPSYDVGAQGSYRILASTAWPEFRVGEDTTCADASDEPADVSTICIPAYGAVVFAREE